MSQRVWFITGASTGLGLALTRRALLRGDCVVATARNTCRFDALLRSPDIDPARLFVLPLDITAPFAVIQDVAGKAIARWGRVDVLVNNAGVPAGAAPSEEFGVEETMKVMQANYAGTMNVTNAFLPHMRGRREGTILVVGSRSAYRNEFLGASAYAASKAAVHSYGETLAAEMHPFGIRVTIVVPGTFDTAMGEIQLVGAPIAAYDSARNDLRRVMQLRKDQPGKGDPERGMDVLVDLVRGEGRAAGKNGWPLWVCLGEDAIANVKARAEKLRRMVEDWESIGIGLGKET